MNRTEALEFEGVDFVSKKYKFGFDIWGMIVFLIIMLPISYGLLFQHQMIFLERSRLP